MKGLIALDIDGTVAGADHAIPTRVHDFLATLVEQDWRLAFITGRTFTYGFQALHICRFPYLYAAYNGALTLHMPERKMVQQHMVEAHFIPLIDELCREVHGGVFIHAGIEQGDTCFYRADEFEGPMHEYLVLRRDQTQEPWVGVTSFDELTIDRFCYAKAFGSWDGMRQVEREIHAKTPLATSVIADPLRPTYAVILITHECATKAQVVAELRSGLPEGSPVIAAGDDYNDLDMIAAADVGIAMATAPEEVRRVATLLAPPATEGGIVEGLIAAIERARL